MSKCTLHYIFSVAAFAFVSGSLVLADGQSSPPAKPPPASSLVDVLHYKQPRFNNWGPLAQISPGGKLFVVTLKDPTHSHSCRIRSFTADELHCKGLGARTYSSQEIAALIVPGDHDFRLRFVAGANAALGAAIWGTVVLAPVCIPCAVGTAIGAFFAFSAAGAVFIGDGKPDSILYLAPGQTLQVKLRY